MRKHTIGVIVLSGVGISVNACSGEPTAEPMPVNPKGEIPWSAAVAQQSTATTQAVLRTGDVFSVR